MKRFTRAGAVLAVVVASIVVTPTAAMADIPGPHHTFTITREGDVRLPGHTIFRPTNLAAPGFKLPIVVWANGGCRNSNEEYRYFLMNFAARGFFIVANGPPENPYNSQELDGIANPQPRKLIDAIDWAIAENGRRASKYFGLLDTGRIAAMGQSCGGWEAVNASADPRIATTVVWNNGGDPHGDVSKVRGPIAFFNGGSRDFMFWNARIGYERTPDGIPALHGSNPAGGHTDWWDDPPDGSHPPIQREPLLLAQRWLELTLYGKRAARAFFIGDACVLCGESGWSVESKSWESFNPRPSEAPPRRG